MTIKHIAIHHTGGVKDNPLASSAHLTAADIDRYHKQEWNFPALLNSPYQYTGYNFIYDPKMRGFSQHRYIGEQTVAQKGYNFDTLSCCIIGNYTRIPLTRRSVDELKATTIEDITQFLLDLLDGNKKEWAVAPNTKLALSPFRIRPHRFYNPGHTECYGDFIPDDFFMKQVLRAKHKWLGNNLVAFLAWLNSFQNNPPVGAAVDNRSCLGYIERLK